MVPARSATVGAVHRMTTAERQARLAIRHRLAAPEPVGVLTVAGDLVGLHATDPASVYLAAAARCRSVDVAGIEQELYEERSLARMLGMRRTMFVVPTDLAPVVQAACTDEIAAKQRRLLVQQMEQTGVAEDGEGWLAAVEEDTLAALARQREATACWRPRTGSSAAGRGGRGRAASTAGPRRRCGCPTGSPRWIATRPRPIW